ncbi:flavodoxin domain-containing protein [Clostridium sp.]|uniref:flavodoxin domain-containing protein n=1 Tax=Clostridium sp. TaxID=1506 RepID=UPI0028467266|nr:flavodoxin domain-containing protein [Clostridium sp.]MDR3594948.1 flavodoxin domain-containing protein [Clostridium sp.]
MKTLIVYGTKHGSAEKCCKLLKNKISGEVITINIKIENVPDLSTFDNVIIGGSIYAGQIQKEIKNFCLKNIETLKSKRVGLFICGLSGDKFEEQLNNAFPKELASCAIAKEFFGGEFIFKNANFLEKFIMKKIAKTDKDSSNLLEENISKLAKSMGNR